MQDSQQQPEQQHADMVLFGTLPLGTRFLFRGRRYLKIALSMTEDEKRNGCAKNYFGWQNRCRPALDLAIARDIPHGGCCPKARKCEDGILAQCYNLQETPSSDCPQRTEWKSDGTVIFSITPVLTGGSRKTLLIAQKRGKPLSALTLS